MSEVDLHIENCGVCGDGKGVCLQGYLMTVEEARNVTGTRTDYTDEPDNHE